MKKVMSIVVTAALAVSALSLTASAEDTEKAVKIYFTNDVHSATSGDVDFAAISGMKQEALDAGNSVFIVDAGDAIQGSAISALTDGEAPIEIMNEVGYDVAVPGNHEFDYGMDRFKALAEEAEFTYLSTNFIDTTTNKPVFDAYEIKEANGLKIAFLGICTPETLSKANPTFFQDKNGNYIYSFCQGGEGADLYKNVQASIDAAKAAGADLVIAVAHLGVDLSSQPWTSKEVIANTTGLNAVIDGHSHSTIEGENVTDKGGNTVVLASTGTKLAAIGEMTITADKKITTTLRTSFDVEAASDSVKAAYNKTAEFVAAKTAEFDELLNTVVAKSDVNLITIDPETETRIIRTQESNLGDLCADAYRAIMGADIAFVNGGGIRADIAAGDITYGQIIAVHPYGNMSCLIEATGAQILDALELGAAKYPAESGGFLQVSGITYTINTSIPSPVVLSEEGAFVSVDGERRVSNVMVGGVAIDENKTYTLAGHNYMLKSCGDGYTMFKGNTILKDETYVDNEVLIKYITENLGGVVSDTYKNLYGEGRVELVETQDSAETPDTTTEAPATTDESGKGDNTDTGVSGIQSVVIIMVAAIAVIGGTTLLAVKKKRK